MFYFKKVKNNFISYYQYHQMLCLYQKVSLWCLAFLCIVKIKWTFFYLLFVFSGILFDSSFFGFYFTGTIKSTAGKSYDYFKTTNLKFGVFLVKINFLCKILILSYIKQLKLKNYMLNIKKDYLFKCLYLAFINILYFL